MMQREQSEYRGEEPIVARPGETHILRGETHIVNTRDEATRSGAEVGEDARPEVIRAEIESTRAEMSQTIDAIQEKLAPEVLKEQAMDVVREASEQAKDVVREVSDSAGQAVHDATIGRAEQFFSDVDDSLGGVGSTIMDAIRENPIPAALVGLGLGWMFFNSRSQTGRRRSRRAYFDTHYDAYPDAAERERLRGRWSGYGRTRSTEYPSEVEPGYGNYRVSPRTHLNADTTDGENLAGRAGDAVGGLANRAGETVGDVANRAGDTVGDLAGRAGDTMGDFADQARYRAQQAQGTFQQQILENPLAMGAIALGIGAAVGLAAPKTRAEDKLMGEARDRVMGQAHSFVRDAGDKVQHLVDQAGQTLQEGAGDATQRAGEKLQDSLDRAGSYPSHGSTGETGRTYSSPGPGTPSGSDGSPGGQPSTPSGGTHRAMPPGSSAGGTSPTSGGASDPSSSLGGTSDPLPL